jgi:hypothetical protein
MMMVTRRIMNNYDDGNDRNYGYGNRDDSDVDV